MSKKQEIKKRSKVSLTQQELARYYMLSAQRAGLNKAISDLRSVLLEKLEGGASIEDGEYTAFLKKRKRKGNIEKTIVDKYGEEMLDEILSATPKTEYKVLEVGKTDG